MKKIVIKLIKKYQVATSNKNPTCRYHPTCSNYAIDAYKNYNFIYASILTVWRILRCNPFSKGGYDPIPKYKNKRHLYLEIDKEKNMKNLVDEYNSRTKDYKKWIFIKLFLAIAILTIGLILTVIYYDRAIVINIAFWVFSSVLFAFLLLTIGMFFYVSEKPMYEFLYKALLEEIFTEEDIEYTYESFPKDKEFLQKGHLFSKSHSNEIRYKLSFKVDDQLIDIYNIYVYSKAHKSNKLIFNGIYMVFHLPNLSAYQLRTKGLLNYKNKNLELIEDNSKFQIFAKKNTSLPVNVTTVFNKLTKRFYDHVYISGVRNQIHVAIDKFNHQHSTKSLSNQEVDRIKDDLESLIDLAFELNKDFN